VARLLRDELRWRPLLVDGLLVLFLLFLAFPGWGTDGSFWVRLAFSIAMTIPLLLRRRHPAGVFTAVTFVAFLQWAFEIHVYTFDMALLVALYTVAAYSARRYAVAALAVAEVGVILAALRWWHGSVGSLVAPAAVLAAGWILGDNIRTRRAYLAELEERAARLERERDNQAQVAAAAERARIARELHDVVAHHVSVMVVQADGAAYALDDAPHRSRAALATISTTGRQALAEMRRLLGVLRSDPEDADLQPQPGVAQLTDLLAQLRSTGLPVNLVVEGVPTPLPTGMDLTAYRLVQEALTNALKHGGPRVRATVRICYLEDQLEIQVEDDGRGPQPESAGNPAGHGLVGMRERAAVYGGEVATGPRAGGGYRVVARLPLGAGVR
jgi:signal transduction histidine kinase